MQWTVTQHHKEMSCQAIKGHGGRFSEYAKQNKPVWEVLVTQSCLTLCDPIVCSLPVSSVCGYLGFSRQEYWNRLPFPSSGDLPDPGIEPTSLGLAGRFFTTEPLGEPVCMGILSPYWWTHMALRQCCQVYILLSFYRQPNYPIIFWPLSVIGNFALSSLRRMSFFSSFKNSIFSLLFMDL